MRKRAWRRWKWCALGLGALALASTVGAGPLRTQQEECTSDEHRQFDFWVGRWEVTNPQGKIAGHSHVQSILGGCVILEEWSSEGSPFAGKSFNIYDTAKERWHQTWVDNVGRLLLLNGGVEEGKMVLRGERSGPGGARTFDEISWTPLEGGKVQQVWRISTDGGETWKTAFDGTYAPTQ